MDTTTTIQPTPPLDAAGRVAIDLPCDQCGYDLLTLARDGRCPECGRDVAQSINTFLDRPPEWLKSVGNAASALGTIWVVVVLMVVLAIGASIADIGALGLLIPLSLLLGLLSNLLWIPITRPEPRSSPPRPPRLRDEFSARHVVRYCLIAVPFLIGLAFAVDMLPGPSARSVSWIPVGLFVIPLMLLPLAALRHLTSLLRRIVHPRLARDGAVLFWLVLGLEVLAAACAVAGSSKSPVFLPLSILLLLLAPIAFFSCAAFLIRAGKALTKAAEDAWEQTAGMRIPQPTDMDPPQPTNSPPNPAES